MSSLQIAKEIVWGDYLKVIAIEPHTGKYEVVKEIDDPTGAEARLRESKNIFVYCQKMMEEWLVHPDMTQVYLSSLKHFLKLRKENIVDGKRFSRKFLYRVGGKYIWTSFDIIYPMTRSTDDIRVCLLCIRRADSSLLEIDKDSTTVPNMIAPYMKVLKVDLADGSFEIVKLQEEEKDDVPASNSITNWFSMFVAEKKVHQDDEDSFREFTRLDRIREVFAETMSVQKCKYRRLVGGEWEWVIMEIAPCIEYSEETPLVMLYVREGYSNSQVRKHESPHRAAAGDNEHRDAVTGLHDQTAMQNDMLDIESKNNLSGIGVITASLNTLAYTIGALGIGAGEELERTFATRMTEFFIEKHCYKTGADEYVVIQPDVASDTFEKWARNFRTGVMIETPPVASIGYAWEKYPESILDLIRKADEMKAAAKKKFAEKYPRISTMRHAPSAS